jgi:hypothetical protein
VGELCDVAVVWLRGDDGRSRPVAIAPAEAAARVSARDQGQRADDPPLFALVANRALAPGSKLAAAGWVTRRAHIDGLAETSDDACVTWADAPPNRSTD